MWKLDFFLSFVQQTSVLVKAFWRCFEDVFSVIFFWLPRRLQDVFTRRLEDVLEISWRRCLVNMSWRCLEEVLRRSLTNTSWRRLENVLEDEKLLRRRRLEKQEIFAGMIVFFLLYQGSFYQSKLTYIVLFHFF